MFKFAIERQEFVDDDTPVFLVVFGGFVWYRINLFRAIQHHIKFQTFLFSISVVFVYKQLNVKTVQLNLKTVLF